MRNWWFDFYEVIMSHTFKNALLKHIFLIINYDSLTFICAYLPQSKATEYKSIIKYFSGY